MHNTIQIIGNLGRDPEQREARANGAPFTVLSVATRRSWKNAEGGWESRTDWHRVACFQRVGESALALHKGDQVFVTGSLVSSKYDRQVGSGNKATTLKLTSWQIRANVLRKLNRAAKDLEATASGSQDGSDSAPF
jgi:single-strand DNA-binding protein